MIKNKPLVTIITPAYNREDLIEETILSILNQDYSNIEYIVLNDGSKDKSLEVIKKFKNKIKIYSHRNMGEAKTVNKGFNLAKGDYIMVVNSDDPLYPGAISESVRFMQKHPEVTVGYPDWNYIDENSKILNHVKVPKFNFQYMVGEHKCFVGPGAVFHRGAIKITNGRDSEFRYVGDFDFWLRLGLKVKFAKIPKTLATFRVHSGSVSISNQSSKMAEEDIKLIDKFYCLPNLPKNIIKIKKQAYSEAHFHAAQVSGKNKKLALSHFKQSVIFNPRKLLDNNFYKTLFFIIFLKK